MILQREATEVQDFDARGGGMIRHPQPAEVDAILALFDDEVRAGRMLPRQKDRVRRELDRWLVAEDGGEVVGCVSLVFFNGELAEVRSLAVRPDYRGQGLATELVRAAVALALELGRRRVLALTRAPRLFEKVGFRRDLVERFPEKVWLDCAPCPFRHACDEIALVYSPPNETPEAPA